jgi:hypothetical protein
MPARPHGSINSTQIDATILGFLRIGFRSHFPGSVLKIATEQFRRQHPHLSFRFPFEADGHAITVGGIPQELTVRISDLAVEPHDEPLLLVAAMKPHNLVTPSFLYAPPHAVASGRAQKIGFDGCAQSTEERYP